MNCIFDVVKIKFTDVPNEFDIYNNFIIDALNKNFRIEFSNSPDFLFYSNFGSDFLTFNNCVRIFFSGEPVIPNFNDCDYSIDYCRLNFADRHFRAGGILANVGKALDNNIQNRSQATKDKVNRKFCNFIYSNDHNGYGAKLRKEFCVQLSKYKSVDCPGRVLNNIKYDTVIKQRYTRSKNFERKVMDESWKFSKIEFLQNYKFTIAFENSSMNGFASEKIVHPFMAYSIPIYWGDPDVGKDFNTNAFINCMDYNNDFDRVINRVIELDNDNEQYLDMLRQAPMNSNYVFNEKERLAEFLREVINRGNSPFEKNPLGFSNVSSLSFLQHCEMGHIGIRIIVQASAAWMKYKFLKKQNKEV